VLVAWGLGWVVLPFAVGLWRRHWWWPPPSAPARRSAQRFAIGFADMP
jgi:hypothetical protein